MAQAAENALRQAKTANDMLDPNNPAFMVVNNGIPLSEEAQAKMQDIINKQKDNEEKKRKASNPTSSRPATPAASTTPATSETPATPKKPKTAAQRKKQEKKEEVTNPKQPTAHDAVNNVPSA